MRLSLDQLFPSFLIATSLPLTAAKAGDDTPELMPPTSAPVVTSSPRLINPTRLPITSAPILPPITTPAPASALIGEPPRAVFSFPGLAGPRTVAPAASSAPARSSAPVEPTFDDGELTLDGPAEMRDQSLPAPRNQLVPLPTLDDLGPGQLHPIPDGTPRIRTPLGPLPDSSLTRPSVTSRRTEPAPAADHATARSSLAPVPRRRFFGLLPGLPVASPVVTPARRTPEGSVSGRDDPDSDNFLSPAAIANARVKQRIEKQARELIGDRARLVEVEVEGKTARVRASGVKFYQKRAVRKALEGVPALSGMRSTIDVQD